MMSDKMTEAEAKFVAMVNEIENIRIRYQAEGGEIHHYITAICTELAHCASAQPEPVLSLASAFSSSKNILDAMLKHGPNEAAKAVFAATQRQMEKEG